MKRKLSVPGFDPVLMDLALVLAASFLMSVVFITAGYMVYVQMTRS